MLSDHSLAAPKSREVAMVSSKLALALLFLAVSASAEDSYEGHKVLRVIPRSQEHLNYLDNLLKNGQGDLDFWSYPVAVGKDVEIHALADVIEELIGDLEERGMQCEIIIENLQQEVEKEKPSARARAGGFDTRYHRLGEIHSEIRTLANQHSDVASIINLGKSYENRDQLAIKINKGTGSKKPLFFFNCGIHAREWISPATCMYMIRQMLSTRGSNSDVQYMLNNFEWVILPVFNVDGYEYTHTRNRMWRKTRKPYSGSYGADPNRNFNYRFAGTGTSQRPSSDIYTGPRPFSEKVTYNVAKYLYSRRQELKGYIDFHAYSQMWMSPWGYTSAYPPEYNKMKTAMTAAVNALTKVHGTRYTYGPAAITIYPTTGDTTDWTFGVLGVVHSYCVELRPKSSGQGGFILPPDKIIPVGQETFAGLKALTRHVN